ncbi:MAG: hypothetical protein KJ620_10730 [Candidatus Edwardsbacteria bacterium]|nr:hypothetical protein [Candidatus Edwardsbacteria bacterium]MBU1576163.1 hypothetical protein [Candidatus Edwardsbacteria bacterium]MBU2463593.1 hypothetical protein [Candidatus Edwardsbacteria bacterium]MBU2593203.1 hypothetical protein [Candidatus Edwardsbacteria bacterium]
MDKSLRERDIEEVLKNANCFPSAVGEVKGIMTVFAKCTIDIYQAIDQVNGNVKAVTKELNETRQEIKAFNDSTSKLSKRLVWLNGILAFATIIGAIATAKVANLF